MSEKSWKQALADQMDPVLVDEIEKFESQIELRREGKIEEKVFAETRLRRGVYGQRYDNGKRHDGIAQRDLLYPANATKGPDTVWDAPGMLRIKIPYGGLNPQQMRVLADLAEEYSDNILHVTTRQDFQLHYIHIDDTPDIMRRLAAAKITTREACGNSVRNVTACPLAGVCHDETFDVTAYANAVAQFLLGHPDTQDFGRKFKIAFSGCQSHACALVNIHDLGGIAKKQVVDGQEKLGFELYVGGGLGTVPHNAKLFAEFVEAEELMPLAQAMARVFARLGEKKNRNKARLKFLVQKLGIEEFKRLVLEERKTMPDDGRWRKYFDAIPQHKETPAFEAVMLNGGRRPEGFDEWMATNVYRQRQAGYAVVTITLPLGDLTSWQMRRLADLAEQHAGENIRNTVEQNMIFRWVSESALPALYQGLTDIGLGQNGAGTIVDITACPGTDTCKLGIAASRGLAGELRTRLASKFATLDEAVKNLHIKVSGCFNSCGQHHIADIGFYGNSRNVSGYTVPHFQVMLGGRWRENGGSYGLAMGAIPSKRIPEVVDLLTSRYVAEREAEETFQDYVTRIGKAKIKEMLQPLVKTPAYTEDKSFYSDWGDPREFTIGDMGVGECAGEVVSLAQFDLALAESMAFQAQLALESKHFELADEQAFKAMLSGAKAIVKIQNLDVKDDEQSIVSEFKARYVDTGIFADTYAKDKFANYFLTRVEEGPRTDAEGAHQLVEETNLFLDACHACEAKLAALAPAGSTGAAK